MKRNGQPAGRQGFTLVEIIVVMAITAIVGTILVTIFTNTLRGSNKAQILAVIKQNGQAVLENMDKTIRGADIVVCNNSNTLVVKKNGIYTRYKFINGMIQQDNPVEGNNLQFFLDNVCTEALVSPFTTLTDTNPQTGVKVDSGSFAVSSSPGYKSAVTINFTLSPGVSAPSIISSQIDPVAFQTTIGLR